MSKHRETIRRRDKARDKARAYFKSLGLIPPGAEGRNWVLHHIDEKMRHEDPDRYVMWRPQDLWPMTRTEHTKLHKPSCSEEARRKIGDVHRGIPLSDEQRKRVSEATRQAMADPGLRQRLRAKKLGALNPNYGKPKSAETIEKSRLAKLGMKFWNNGRTCIRSRTCPGPEWIPGRIKSYEHRT